MLTNYLKVAFRNLWRSRGYALINILGLSVGLSSFLIILLYLNHELSYDRWHPDLDRVYKISLRGQEDIFRTTQAPLAELLRDNASQVEAATSITPDATFEMPLTAAGKRVTQAGTIAADSLFFKVFPYQIVDGDAIAPLNKPNSMVISQAVAGKLFGRENPIGKIVKVYNSYDCEVTAVMKSAGTPTHLDVQIVHRSPNEKNNFHWGNYSYHTYLKTKQPMKEEMLESTLDRVYFNERLKEKKSMAYEEFKKSGHREGLFVDAVHDIHNFPKYGESNMTTVSILLVLASLLLIAGTINFSNLSIATSLRRAKEIGVKKVLGSSWARVFWQFMGETALQCILALGIALLFLNIALPYFSREFNVRLAFFDSGIAWRLILEIVLCLVLVITLSGLYPAVFLSRYNTAKVLKGDYSRGRKGIALRNGLIVAQFFVASFFLFGVVVVSRQLDYMQSRDRGFSGEHVLQIKPYMMSTREENFDEVSSKLLQIPGVKSVSKTTTVPGDHFSDTSTYAFKSEGKIHRLASVKVSRDYFETLDIALLQGRLFNDGYADQHTRSAIINQTAAEILGYRDGKETFVTYQDCDSVAIKVVGVVSDFNVLGLEQKIQPAIFTIGNEACVFQSGGGLLVRLEGDDIRKPVSAIEDLWKTIEPDFGIQFSFLDDNFQQLFASHLRLKRIVSTFGITAIIISLMGLFALTAFLTGQRRKEISIRKVLGAGVTDLSMLLGKDFIRLIAIAVAIAIPVSWWAADEWIRGFAYHAPLNGWIFALSAVSVLSIAAITIGFHILKAARNNVAEDLRDE